MLRYFSRSGAGRQEDRMMQKNRGTAMAAEEDRKWKEQEADSVRAASGRLAPDAGRSMEWNQEEENPFRRKAGIRKFRELYTGKRRKDRTAWSDYFMSGDFLEGYREGSFAELMLETVREYQGRFPPCREFLTEISIAYGVQVVRAGDGLQLQVENSAVFYGIEAVYEILKLSTGVTRFKGNDHAMLQGFRDYRELLMLSMSDWDDDTMLRLGKLIDCYTLSNISDRPIQDAGRYELSQRHPRSMKLITCFFTDRELPDKVYRLVWDHLRLENATLGKEKMLYGGLRETALAHVPALGETQRVSYRELLREFYARICPCDKGETPEGRDILDAWFDREDLLSALKDPSFVEEQILHYWITKGSGAYLLKKLQEYYVNHKEAPFSGQVLQQIARVTESRRTETELLEDEQAEVAYGVFDLRKRAYVRYYLNTAFHLTGESPSALQFQNYLDEKMPYSPEWSKRFADPEQSGFSSEHPVRILFGEDQLQIAFYPRYMEYRWNGSLSVPYYPGENLAQVEDETTFWLLVPVAAAPAEDHQKIRTELMRRMSGFPVNKADIPMIADLIAGQICHFDGKITPVCRSYAAKEEQELLTDRPEELSMEVLPRSIRVKGQWGAPRQLEGPEITRETVGELLSRYFAGNVFRLELAWNGYSLLFIKSGQQYACFYFDHRAQDWYALVSMPEVYSEVDSEDVVYVPFGFGMLPNYLIHPNPDRIMQQINEILEQIACTGPHPKSMMWAPQICRFETKLRYQLAKRQFGGYPEEETENQIMSRFFIPVLPAYVSYTDMEGRSSGKKAVHKNKAALQQVLLDYMAGRLSQLLLVWQYETGNAYSGTVTEKRVIALIQDQGAHMMIWMDDTLKGMEYLVSDVREYLDADDKKYRKVSFLGRTTPGYLVHTDLRRIRNGLDLLIPQMGYRTVSRGGFGEYSYTGGNDYEKHKEMLRSIEEENDTPL